MMFTVSNGEECGAKDTSEVSVDGSNVCSQELSFPFFFRRRKSQYLVEFQHSKCECRC